MGARGTTAAAVAVAVILLVVATWQDAPPPLRVRPPDAVVVQDRSAATESGDATPARSSPEYSDDESETVADGIDSGASSSSSSSGTTDRSTDVGTGSGSERSDGTDPDAGTRIDGLATASATKAQGDEAVERVAAPPPASSPSPTPAVAAAGPPRSLRRAALLASLRAAIVLLEGTYTRPNLECATLHAGEAAAFAAIAERGLVLSEAAASTAGSDSSGPAGSQPTLAHPADPAGGLTVLLFGGSASAAADLPSAADVFAVPGAEWLRATLQVPVTLLNNAVGATGSEYYAFCGDQHMAYGADLVLTEHCVNDPGCAVPADLAANYVGALTEAVVTKARAVAPGAAIVYSCFATAWNVTGADLPGVLAALRHHDVAAVSVRELLGLPGTRPSRHVAARPWSHRGVHEPPP
jgi:hypothetical protein